MEEGPPFTKKETEIGKLSCESMQAGKRSPLETSPSYKNISTARSSMMMPPTCTPPATPKSSYRSPQKQAMISSSCSPKPNHLESNPNPNPNPSLRSTIFSTAEHYNINSNAPFAYRNLATSEQSPANPYLNPGPNPNPNPSPNPSPISSPNRSTARPVLDDDRYTSSSFIPPKSPLNHMLIKHDHRQLHEQSLFDHDHPLGPISSDDHLFGGFRLLPSHATSPFFSEGLQASWSPMITDYPYMSTQREAAALMSPAPEITGLGDLHEAEMSIFTSTIGTARRWSLYDESSNRKGPLDTADMPLTKPSAIDSGIEDQRTLVRLLPAASMDDAQNDLHAVDQSPAHHSPSFDFEFDGKSTANVHCSGGDSEGLKQASPAATEMSSSSASEPQDDEDSNTANQYKPVGAQASYDKLDGGDAQVLEKTEANVDNKPSKKPPRKKGQRRVREARVALLTKSEVEHLEDGYRWRKYGQKAVKNSPHPRSYYRCTNSKCYVKKRVERCNEDPSLVVTTYEGQHTHHSPAVLRGAHDMLDPLVSSPLGTLNYQHNASFMPWHSSLRPPSTHSPSHFTINASLNQLFRPLHAAAPAGFLLSKPLSFPTSPLSIPSPLDPSTSLSRLSSMPPPHPQAAHHFMPRPPHVMQAAHAAHDQVHLLSPPRDNASSTLRSALIDKGLLDDMLSHACTHKPSPPASTS